MKVPFGDQKLHYQTYKSLFDETVSRVMASGQFILGPEVEQFEKAFASYLDSPFVVGCASGTEAIYLALAARGIGPLDEVLVVAHTAVPTISAISMTGATPVFVDIDPDLYLMDVADLENKLTARTRAIVAVHLYGMMADMEPILKLAAKHNLPVIEDAAQATGASYRGKLAGTLGAFGAFSFYPSKNLGAFGDGGAVSCRSSDDFAKLVMLRNYGQSKRYHHDIVGINSRLDELQAAILSAQLPFLSEWNERRRQIANRYTNALKEFVQTPQERSDSRHAYHLYVIQTNQRDELQSYLLDHEIQSLIHYPIPAHRQNAYQYLAYASGSLPVTEYVAKRILSLPMFPELKDEQVDYVIATIKRFCESSPTAKKDLAITPPYQVSPSR